MAFTFCEATGLRGLHLKVVVLLSASLGCRHGVSLVLAQSEDTQTCNDISGSNGGLPLESEPQLGSSLVQRLASVEKVYTKGVYDNIGHGWCRDQNGKFTNFYKRAHGQSDTSCRQQCDSDSTCVAYNFNSPSGECVILAPTTSHAPSGWSFRHGDGATTVTVGSGSGGPPCMKKSTGSAAHSASYVKLAYNTVCQAGTEIQTREECVTALQTLGLPQIHWGGSTSAIPAGCSVQGSSTSAHSGCWNSQATGNARADQAPICKAGGHNAATGHVATTIPNGVPATQTNAPNHNSQNGGMANSNSFQPAIPQGNFGSASSSNVQYMAGDGNTDTCQSGWQRVTDSSECQTSASNQMGRPFQGTGCYMIKSDGCLTDGNSLFFSTGCHHQPGSHPSYKPICRQIIGGTQGGFASSAQYVKGTLGMDDCPLGSMRITDRHMCQQAAAWAGYSQAVQEGCQQMKTEGCIWSNNQAKAYFNTCRMVLTAPTNLPLCVRNTNSGQVASTASVQGNYVASSGASGFVQDLFNAFDRNRDGQVNVGEVQSILQGLAAR